MATCIKNTAWSIKKIHNLFYIIFLERCRGLAMKIFERGLLNAHRKKIAESPFRIGIFFLSRVRVEMTKQVWWNRERLMWTTRNHGRSFFVLTRSSGSSLGFVRQRWFRCLVILHFSFHGSLFKSVDEPSDFICTIVLAFLCSLFQSFDFDLMCF
jgi:hypothetical protein